ncbi:MAG TPA: alpha/beta fold hydrolase [Thermoanaerobaculia bacterium]|jgi:pimeloyl-ACP methyl ester carboxylesterase|nr:alpha/beta fold hydrolase [Thermoanaerobaculia bacterium]
MKLRIPRTLLWLAGGAVAIEIAARLNVRREQARRRALGSRLFTCVLGEGDPVVFVPGYQGSTEFWQHAFDSLASRHRLIFVDALGFGRSPWPDRPPTLDDHLNALRETLIAEGAISRVTLVGHSFGTVLAAYYVERYPDEIDRLLLLGAPVFEGEDDARRRLREISPIAALFSLNRFLAREACMLMCALRPLLETLLPRLKPDLTHGVVHDAVLHDWPSADGALRVLLTRPITEPLRRIGPKVTFIHGDADGITPLARIRELAAETGASVIETSDVHLSYASRSAGLIRERIEAALPAIAGR